MGIVNIRISAVFIVLLALVAGLGCESAYYGTMEKFGYHKRDILVDRVAEARDGQQEAKEQFTSALDQFMAVVEVDGGELQTRYDALKAELAQCEVRAGTVSDRIASVENVADDLFAEWESELDQYASADLRRASERQLNDTRQQYGQLIGTMKRAEAKMQPVLVALRDQVLFLKHNLNARAIASLEGAAVSLESDVQRLVADMQASIDEANAFIASMDIQ